MVGNFNGTINNSLDRKTKKKVNMQEGKLQKSFFKLIKQKSMEDL